MKKRIKLTESDLHRVIKESVKHVISELDWKTYVNAANKRQAQGKQENANQLLGAANKSFNKKHFNNQIGEYDWWANNPDDNYEAQAWGYINHDEGTVNDHRRMLQGNRSGTEIYTANKNGISKTPSYGNDKNVRFDQVSPQYRGQVNRAVNDINNYYSGNSEYLNGYGWRR